MKTDRTFLTAILKLRAHLV